MMDGSRAATLRRQIFELIQAAGAAGRTCDEVERLLGLPHQTASARITELGPNPNMLNLIVDSGLRRKTRSGRLAVAWRAPE